MSYAEDRLPYEFSAATKKEALERSGGRCEICGGTETKDDRFQYDHRLAIWYAREIGGALPALVVASIANCSVIHKSCHRLKHSQESRMMYRELAPEILAAYLNLTAEEQDHRDDWRATVQQYQPKEEHENSRSRVTV